MNQLGIGNIYAEPYHGQAKTVERFFGTFTDRFSRLFPTYTGKDAKARPECMRTSDTEIVKLAPTMEQYIQAVTAYIAEYNSTENGGRDMGQKSPDQVYQENLEIKRVIRDFDALRLLCGNSEERVVHKNGISIKNNSYFNELLLSHLGEHVIVTYDPANIDKVAVFDMDNRAICIHIPGEQREDHADGQYLETPGKHGGKYPASDAGRTPRGRPEQFELSDRGGLYPYRWPQGRTLPRPA